MKKLKTIIFLSLIGCFAAAVAQDVKPQAESDNNIKEVSDSSKKEDTSAMLSEKEQKAVIDQVIWVVGDEAILLSDVEMTKAQMVAEGMPFDGDPDYTIPEQIAVQKLFLHQAALDSIEVTESEIAQGIDQQINYWVQMAGSREKLEEYKKMSISKIRQSLHDDFKNNQLTQRMREKLVEDIKVTPADVRRYFKDMPEDSLPYVPTEVEVEIITRQPRVPQEEVNRIKDELRGYTDRINRGETTFATLARLYSEDPGSARQGGELDYMGRGMLDPAFAAVAFNLTDPSKISKIVESEFGYHIIQLVDKRGDKLKCRHILRKPRISQESIDDAIVKLDSLATEIKAGKFTFEEAAPFVSDDKDTRSNNGLMANSSDGQRTSRFRMQDLPTEVAREVEKLSVGEISNAFRMVNQKGQTVCAIIKLKSRTEGHRATITGDFQAMQEVVVARRREEFIKDWVQKKIRETYVRMAPKYRDYKYHYDGWVH